ncbi:hypothetical protein B0J17DRAFT_724872 [Rhizoctonia solani]|nr:hypothetical protein B0J17DRAFT_724872 [Rhizoctonia solani]
MQLKPLDWLPKKVQTKKQSLELHKVWVTALLTPACNSSKAPSHPTGPTNASTPQPKSNILAKHNQQGPTTNPPSNSGNELTNNYISPTLKVSDSTKQSNTLLLYFGPNSNSQWASTTNKKQLGANSGPQDTEIDGNYLESNDEQWSCGVDDKIADSTSKKQDNVPSMSLSAAKKGNKVPKKSTASTLHSKPHPKPCPPPSNSLDEDTTTNLFCQTTHAAKQEMIDEVEAETGGKGKGKLSTKNKKGGGNEKKKAK